MIQTLFIWDGFNSKYLGEEIVLKLLPDGIAATDGLEIVRQLSQKDVLTLDRTDPSVYCYSPESWLVYYLSEVPLIN